MTKPVGATQRKGKKGRDKNHMIASWRKWKNQEKLAKQAELDRFNNLCGPVTITYKTPQHIN
jgi:hypothetical protein